MKNFSLIFLCFILLNCSVRNGYCRCKRKCKAGEHEDRSRPCKLPDRVYCRKDTDQDDKDLQPAATEIPAPTVPDIKESVTTLVPGGTTAKYCPDDCGFHSCAVAKGAPELPYKCPYRDPVHCCRWKDSEEAAGWCRLGCNKCEVNQERQPGYVCYLNRYISCCIKEWRKSIAKD